MTGRWNTIACRRGPPTSSGVRQAIDPDVGRSKPWHSRSSTLLPAPFGPRMTVRAPRSIVTRDAVDDAPGPDLEHDVVERERQQGERRAHVRSAAQR